jgi:hypothetical protein
MTRCRLPEADGRKSGQHSIEHTKDATSPGNSDTLPTNKSVHAHNVSSATMSIPAGAPANDPKGSDAASVQQTFTCTFDKYGGLDQQWGKIELKMMPNLDTPKCLETPWAGVLEVKCRDVARLMREGFFWSAENVLPEEGYMAEESRPEWLAIGCRHKRTWILADRSSGQEPQWVGSLEVVSPHLEVLSRFRLQNLSRKNIYSAGAWNALEQMVYSHDYRYLSKSFNCIYDDKPLKGWWPWPREDGICTAFPNEDQLFPPAFDSGSGWEFESESEFDPESWHSW